MASPSGSSSPSTNTTSSSSTTAPPSSDPELAQIFADLARGEKTAQALESHLSTLEKKIDDLLASVEQPPPAPPTPTRQDPECEKSPADAAPHGPGTS